MQNKILLNKLNSSEIADQNSPHVPFHFFHVSFASLLNMPGLSLVFFTNLFGAVKLVSVTERLLNDL
jgi:hypothetical protein